MKTVTLGNKLLSINQDTSLAELLINYEYSNEYYAVALNRTFIPRSHHAMIILNEGDVIDIVMPMQGG
jgi:sulfur carrier protein